ncbi:MAG: c-type cytochrome domain-containing protein [Opitutaceae bacterium]
MQAQEPVAAEVIEPWPVYLFLERHCAECHGGHVSRPKADFGYILDLPRLIDDNYIIPGEPENSDLYLALISEDEDVRMPPEDSESPHPDAAAVEMVRQWIASGAPLDNAAATSDVTKAADASINESAEEAAPDIAEAMPLGRVVGRLHPLLVHFPIALVSAPVWPGSPCIFVLPFNGVMAWCGAACGPARLARCSPPCADGSMPATKDSSETKSTPIAGSGFRPQQWQCSR